MNLKLFILFAIIGFSFAADINLTEGTVNFKETIEVDEAKGTEYYRTPNHGTRIGVKQIVDTATGLVADKIDGDERCIVYERNPTVDPSVKEVENGLKQSKGQFPYQEFTVVENNILTVPMENPEKLSHDIKAFCRNREIVKGLIENKPEIEIEKIAVEIAEAGIKNERKRAVITNFMACKKEEDAEMITKCMGENKKLKARCKVVKPTCTYKLTCPMKLNLGGFHCKGVHKENNIFCCDYFC